MSEGRGLEGRGFTLGGPGGFRVEGLRFRVQGLGSKVMF